MRLSAGRLTRDSFLALVLATEASLIFVALVLSLIFPVPFAELMGGSMPMAIQVFVGLVASGILFLAVTFVVWLFPSVMDTAGGLLREVIGRARPTTGDCALISAGAGVGEELLFRAVLYPLLGPLGSAAVFGLAHGFNAESWAGRLMYVAATFIVGLFLGWIFITFGLIAAIVCHASYDFIALEALRRDAFPHHRQAVRRAP